MPAERTRIAERVARRRTLSRALIWALACSFTLGGTREEIARWPETIYPADIAAMLEATDARHSPSD